MNCLFALALGIGMVRRPACHDTGLGTGQLGRAPGMD